MSTLKERCDGTCPCFFTPEKCVCDNCARKAHGYQARNDECGYYRDKPDEILFEGMPCEALRVIEPVDVSVAKIGTGKIADALSDNLNKDTSFVYDGLAFYSARFPELKKRWETRDKYNEIRFYGNTERIIEAKHDTIFQFIETDLLLFQNDPSFEEYVLAHLVIEGLTKRVKDKSAISIANEFGVFSKTNFKLTKIDPPYEGISVMREFAGREAWVSILVSEAGGLMSVVFAGIKK